MNNLVLESIPSSNPRTPTKQTPSSRSNIPSPNAKLASPKFFKQRNVSLTPPSKEQFRASVKSFYNHNKENISPSDLALSDSVKNHSNGGGNLTSISSFYEERMSQLSNLETDVQAYKVASKELALEIAKEEERKAKLWFESEKVNKEIKFTEEQNNFKQDQLEKLNENHVLKEKNVVEGHLFDLDQAKINYKNELKSMVVKYKKKYKLLEVLRKQKVIDQRDILSDKLKSLIDTIENNDKILTSKRNEIANNNESEKTEWLTNHEMEGKKYSRNNEEKLYDIFQLSDNIKKVLEVNCNIKRKNVEVEKEEILRLKDTLDKQTKKKIDIADKISDLNEKLKALYESTELQHKLILKNSYKKKQISEKIIKAESIRRNLHNQFQNARGNIRVFCRIKPPKITQSTNFIEVEKFNDSTGSQNLIIEKPKNLPISNNNNNYKFTFDHIFKCDDNNEEVFKEIEPLIQSALDGYNVCIFAYGQTGSGKTYTMMNSNDGVIPQTIKYIFSSIDRLKEKGWEYNLSCEFIEMYNENIIDLFGDGQDRRNSMLNNNNDYFHHKHEIKHDVDNLTTNVTNLICYEIKSENDFDKLLEISKKTRMTSSTKCNEHSSRSHAIFTIYLNGENKITGEKSKSKLNLVDLAGSERINNSKVQGERLKETQNINKSLSSLGDVIFALNNQRNNKHVPFRNNKLTYLLKYSLIGQSKTLMFVNVSPDIESLNETLNSLRFATKVNQTSIDKEEKK